nr:hypothetical protein [Tanacetum cinerariifolium]
TIMSDFEDSTVMYTTVSSPYEGRSGDISPVIDGPPLMPEDPYAYVVAAFQALPPPDYVPGPEEPEQAPPLPFYIPYVPELSDPDEDPEEDDDEDPEEDPADYPADHDDKEEEEKPSRDDADEEDKEQDEDDDDDEEEYPASADSILPPPALQDIGYGIRDTWIDLRDVAEEEALTTLEGVNTRVTKLIAVQEQDTQNIYGVTEDTQGRQTEILQRVEALVDDSQYHYETG